MTSLPPTPRLVGAAALALLTAIGCVANSDGFAKKAAKLDCQRLEECVKVIFDDEYGGDMGRCRDDVETDTLDTFDALEDLGCEYDPQEGRECIREARKLKSDCSEDASRDIVDACDRVFDCPGNLDLDDEKPPEFTAERESDAPVTGPVCEGALNLDR